MRLLTARWGIIALVLGCVLLGGCQPSADEMRDAAQAALARGDAREAHIHLRNLVQAVPDDGAARLQLAESYFQQGDAAGAEAQVLKAQELGVTSSAGQLLLLRARVVQGNFASGVTEFEPDDFEAGSQRAAALTAIGISYRALGDVASAELAFERALEEDPNAGAAKLELAVLLASQGRLPEADNFLNEVLQDDPQHLGGLLARSSLRRQQGDGTAARADLETVLTASARTDPSYLAALVGLTELDLDTRSMATAGQHLDMLEEMTGSQGGPLISFLRARWFAQSGELEEAKSRLRKLLAVSPNFLPAERLLGVLHGLMGEYGQAEMFLTRVLKQQPRDVLARQMLAEIQLRLNNPGAALETVAESIGAADGESTGLLLLAGRASLQAGDREAALEYFSQSIAGGAESPLGPGVELAQRLQVASTLVAAGEYAEAQSALTAEGADDVQLVLGAMRRYVTVLQHGAAGELGSALEGARALAVEYPNEVWSNNLWGGIALANNETSEADAAFSKTLSINEKSDAALLGRGQIALRRGERDAARRWVEQAVAANPGSEPGLLALANLQSDLVEATATLQQARKVLPQSMLARRRLLPRLLAAKQFDEARVVADEIFALDGDAASRANIRGLILRANGENSAAIESFQQAVVGSDGQNSDFLLNLAQSQAAAGQLDAATETINRLPQSDRDTLNALALAFQINLAKREYAMAGRALERAQSHHEGAFGVRLMMADLAAANGEREQALSIYRELVGELPSATLATKVFALSRELGEPNPEQVLRGWLENNPGDVRVRMALATHLQTTAAPAEAVREYEAVLESNPDHAAALNNLAWMMYESGRPEALGMAQRAHSAAPDNPAILDTLGWILAEQNAVGDALLLLKEALAKAPEVPDIKLHLAHALARNGDLDASAQLLEELINENVAKNVSLEAQQLLASVTARRGEN